MTPAVHLRDARVLRVVAHLQSGAALPRVFPAALDGVLASAARRRRLGGGYGGLVDHHVEGLPLASTRPGKLFGRQWVWLASCARPVGGSTVDDVRWWHKRFDETEAEQIVDRLPASTSTGPFKSWRVPILVTVASALEWWAVGDRDGIVDLLGDVCQIGHKRSMGEGLVVGWDVEDCGPVDPAEQVGGNVTRVWWADDGTIARPVPSRGAAVLGLGAVDVVPHTIRPPYWRAPQTEAGGGFARAARDVIAPWTRRQEGSP